MDLEQKAHKEDITDSLENIPDRTEVVERILNRGVIVDVLPDKESFRQRLLSTEPMKIYIGADPTSTTLHLSHAKNYMLLEEFRKLGHEVIVLFGDFTARIGDPTEMGNGVMGNGNGVSHHSLLEMGSWKWGQPPFFMI